MKTANKRIESFDMRDHRICTRCILDTAVPTIRFDQNGECNYCKIHDQLEKKYPLGAIGQRKINEMVEEIKHRGRKRKYDCIVGVSGGTDSTYCLYLAKKWGLRALAVHLDNQWNSEIAISNIKKTVDKLGVGLKMVKVDWEEYKNLQIAFLKASVPEIEIPTDIAVYATLFKIAAEENVPSVVNGHSFRTEGTAPLGWTYMDGRYIKSVYRKFGKDKKLKNFPNLEISNLLYYVLIKRIKEYRPLEYMDYDKQEAGKNLEKKFEWKYYGGHHYESIYTRFVTSYVLIRKFDIDKRKVSLSALVRTGKITREDALEKIKERPYPEKEINEDMVYVLRKLGLSQKEFEELMSSQIKSFLDYPTYYTMIKSFRIFIKIACMLRLVPEILYEKYAK